MVLLTDFDGNFSFESKKWVIHFVVFLCGLFYSGSKDI